MADELVAVVYANFGRWVAMCPRGCMNAERFGMQEATPGKPGGLTHEIFLCSDCGWTGPAVWPAKAAEIEALLNLRPLQVNRNWVPGETLADLHIENLEHGVFDPRLLDPAAADATPDGKVFQLTGDDLELGPAAISADVARLALGGG